MNVRFGKYGVLGSLPAWGPIEAFRAHETGAPRNAGDVRLERVLLRDDARSAETIRSWTQVRHPAAVRVLDVFDVDNHRIVVRTFHEGITLDRLLDHVRVEGTPLSLDAALHIAASVAAAVADVGVWSGTPSIARAHGLLTPEVVLVERDGTVRVSGHAARLLLADAEDGVAQIRPGYASPEPDSPPTEADAFALAALCFELFTGERPPLDASRARLEGREVLASPELVGAVDATLAARGDDRLRAAQRLSFRLRRAQRPDTGRPQLKAVLETLPSEEDDVDAAIHTARAALEAKRQGAKSIAAMPAVVQPVIQAAAAPVVITEVVTTAVEPVVATSAIVAREASLMAAVAASEVVALEPPREALTGGDSTGGDSTGGDSTGSAGTDAPKEAGERIPTARPWAVQRAQVGPIVQAIQLDVTDSVPPAAPAATRPVPADDEGPELAVQALVAAPAEPEPAAPVVPAAILAVTDLTPAPAVVAPAPPPPPPEALAEPAHGEPRSEVVSDEPAVVPEPADPTMRMRRTPEPPTRSRAPLFLGLVLAAGLGGFALIKSGVLDGPAPTVASAKPSPKPSATKDNVAEATSGPATKPVSTASAAVTASAPVSVVPSASVSVPPPTPSTSTTASVATTVVAEPGDLPAGHAWVTLKGADGTVVVNGKKVGKSNQKVAIACGWPWIVIAEYDDKDRLVRTLSKSQQYTVKCGVENVHDAPAK